MYCILSSNWGCTTWTGLGFKDEKLFHRFEHSADLSQGAFLINLSKTVLIRSSLNCQHLPDFSDWCPLEVFPSVWRMALWFAFQSPCPHQHPLSWPRGGHLPNGPQLQRELHQWDGPIVARERWNTARPVGAGGDRRGGLHRLQNQIWTPARSMRSVCSSPGPGRVAPAPWACPQDQDQVCWWVWGSGPLVRFWWGLTCSLASVQVAHAPSALLGPPSGHRRSLHHWATPVDSDLRLVLLRTSPPLFSCCSFTPSWEYHLVLMEIIPKSTQTVHFNDVRSSVSTSYPVSSVYAPVDVLVAWWWGWGALWKNRFHLSHVFLWKNIEWRGCLPMTQGPICKISQGDLQAARRL